MKALVVEDEALIRELFASILGGEFEFAHVDEAQDGATGWELFQAHRYDFVALDLLLPKLDGLSLATRMLELRPSTRILILSSECDDYTIREATHRGVLGFVDKTEMSLEVLFAAFNNVTAGDGYFSFNAQQVIAKLWQDPQAYYKLLSPRELQVIRLIAKGYDAEQSAQVLRIQSSTVRRHKSNVMKKLQVRDEACLVRYALQIGMIKFKSGLDWTESPDQGD